MDESEDLTLKNVLIVLDRIVSEANEETTEIYPLKGVDVETMMKLGLFPENNFDQYFVDRITMDDETFYFWNRNFDLKNGRRYENELRWYYSTLDLHKRNGIHKAVSIPLIYLKPDLVYNVSRRPKTDMDIFRSPLSTVVSKDRIVNGKIDIQGQIWNVIPVTRYGSGMKKGMYHLNEESNGNGDSNGDIEKEYCGTFYYYEPESSTYLAYMTSRTYFNKTDALDKLGQEFDNEYIDTEYTNVDLRTHIDGTLPGNLMMTPKEYVNYCSNVLGYLNNDNIMKANNVPQIPHYIATEFNLYAIEDEYDQDLCEAGRDNGIQIIVLTNMVGSHQVVTEVLDTRDRVESFKSLIYTY